MAEKITTALTMQEFTALIGLLDEKENLLRLIMADDHTPSPLKTTLLRSLTEQQRAEYIRQEVKKVLSRATGIPPEQINDGDELRQNLHMNNLFIRALAVPFTHIARQFNPSAVITPDNCEECETVIDCIGLVTEKSKT